MQVNDQLLDQFFCHETTSCLRAQPPCLTFLTFHKLGITWNGATDKSLALLQGVLQDSDKSDQKEI